METHYREFSNPGTMAAKKVDALEKRLEGEMNQIKTTVEERMSSMEEQVADLRDMIKKMLEVHNQATASVTRNGEGRSTNSEIRREEDEAEIVSVAQVSARNQNRMLGLCNPMKRMHEAYGTNRKYLPSRTKEIGYSLIFQKTFSLAVIGWQLPCGPTLPLSRWGFTQAAKPFLFSVLFTEANRTYYRVKECRKNSNAGSGISAQWNSGQFLKAERKVVVSPVANFGSEVIKVLSTFNGKVKENKEWEKTSLQVKENKEWEKTSLQQQKIINYYFHISTMPIDLLNHNSIKMAKKMKPMFRNQLKIIDMPQFNQFLEYYKYPPGGGLEGHTSWPLPLFSSSSKSPLSLTPFHAEAFPWSCAGGIPCAILGTHTERKPPSPLLLFTLRPSPGLVQLESPGISLAEEEELRHECVQIEHPRLASVLMGEGSLLVVLVPVIEALAEAEGSHSIFWSGMACKFVEKGSGFERTVDIESLDRRRFDG
ncbi:hypothetical protein M5K25_008511 [Dendrobium thyrsiflorum]|uniref:Uncharacterized protein n=1 Tax=Dendrobium thyrsiflorum TaxID=117978 RepID=A0ABD0V9G4_DENTH